MKNGAIKASYKDSIEMTDNYAKYAKRQNPPAGNPGVAPLSADEKAELKMRIMLAINGNMA